MNGLMECFDYGKLRKWEEDQHQELMDREDEETEELENELYYDNADDFEINE
jgi:hypothetical protein